MRDRSSAEQDRGSPPLAANPLPSQLHWRKTRSTRAWSSLIPLPLPVENSGIVHRFALDAEAGLAGRLAVAADLLSIQIAVLEALARPRLAGFRRLARLLALAGL